MFRSIVLLAGLVLVIGCGKKKREEGPPDAAPGGEPNPRGTPPGTPGGGANLAGLPKIQPKAKFKVPGERGYERSLQLSGDGRTLAVALTPLKSKILVWDLTAEPKGVAEFPGHAFALSPSGKLLLATGTSQQTVYDVAAKNPVAKADFASSHAYFRDENTIVATLRSHDFDRPSKGKITLWDVAKNADAGSFEIPDNRFDTALLANGGKELWLFVSNKKFEVECYDLDAKKLLRTVKPENDTGRPFSGAGIWQSIAPDSSVFAAQVTRMRFYDAVTGKIVGSLPDDLAGTPTGFLPGGARYLARAGKYGSGLELHDRVIYDWKAKKGLAVLTGHGGNKEDEPLATASADGRILVSVTKSGEGLVFDLSALK